jgi:hypothetical protein
MEVYPCVNISRVNVAAYSQPAKAYVYNYMVGQFVKGQKGTAFYYLTRSNILSYKRPGWVDFF